MRIDVFVETDSGEVIDIEMQAADMLEGELPLRTRYYQSLIDMATLAKGHTYMELKRSYIIFLCAFDPFGEGRKMYTFSNHCHESENLELGKSLTRC